MRIGVSLTDVRQASDLADYTGELELKASLRITDRANGSGDEAATVIDTPLQATAACAATDDSERGAACSVLTSANTLAPGTVESGKRAIWELGTVEVYDGGPDGIAGTTEDNDLFARQGLFVP